MVSEKEVSKARCHLKFRNKQYFDALHKTKKNRKKGLDRMFPYFQASRQYGISKLPITIIYEAIMNTGTP